MSGGVLSGQVDRGLGLVRRFANYFIDRRDPRYFEHQVDTLVGQGNVDLALSYEGSTIMEGFVGFTSRTGCSRATALRYL